MGRHARSDYLVEARGKLQVFRRGGAVEDVDVSAFQRENQTYPYTHIFGEQDKGSLPSECGLKDLGAAMAKDPADLDTAGCIPAGYTYLGQFIFHDISYMEPGKGKHSFNSPVLDLDSVIALDKVIEPENGCIDRGPLPLGCTSGSVIEPQDLPRKPYGTEKQGKPLIADDRNDEFLPLAQCHLMMLKFFNAVARHEGYDDATGAPPECGWDGVRRIWLQHFQSVVLHDYLPRIIDRATYDDVMRERLFVRKHATEENWFPAEFAGALGRFGHSMIRDDYRPWNRLTGSLPVSISEFMEFTHANSGDGLASHWCRLPRDWITNWFQLFDFSGTRYAGHAVEPLKASLINTHLASGLAQLPVCLLEEKCMGPPTGYFSLAQETLKRGRNLGLASAQEALRQARIIIPSLPEVPTDEIPGSDPAIVSAFTRHEELKTRTPLWFYMLREAEYFADGGKRLGPLAGRIVMETIHAAIEASSDSILKEEGWRPKLLPQPARHFTMPDLIAFTRDPNPLDGIR